MILTKVWCVFKKTSFPFPNFKNSPGPKASAALYPDSNSKAFTSNRYTKFSSIY